VSIITIENLYKEYHVSERDPGFWGAAKGLFSRRKRIVKALDGISLNLDQGEMVGYIGPNGAGKSTTVKLLAGILVPDSGSCLVKGRVPWKDRIDHVREIGVVFGQRTQLWWDLPVLESFQLLKKIYGIPQAVYRTNLEELIDLLSLKEFLSTPVRQLSLGERMRCDLVAALLHSPSLLFLDEPTIGLDAVSKLAVRDFIRKLNSDHNITVILTTHDMDDIETLCSRIVVLHKGTILCDGSLEQLRGRVSADRRMIMDLAVNDQSVNISGCEVVSRVGRRVELKFDPMQVPTADLIGQVASEYQVQDIFIENPPIEEIIAQIYREADR
jgi:ABC-2 type transport system ATP-binding protein